MSLIEARRDKPLTERQAHRVLETLAAFDVGPCWRVVPPGMPPEMLRQTTDEEGPWLHSSSRFSYDERGKDGASVLIVIDYGGDEAKVPDLIQALRFCGFVSRQRKVRPWASSSKRSARS